MGEFYFWDISTRKITNIPIEEYGDSIIYSIAYSPNGE